MTSVSVLSHIHKTGLFGNYENKNEENLLIVQIVQYKNSSALIKDINIDGVNLINEALKVSCNNDTRILWSGPKNWFLVSKKK